MEQQASPSPAAPPATAEEPTQGPCLWDLLPEDCRRVVLAHLSRTDAARAAGACRDFAAWARTSREAATSLAIPKMISAVRVSPRHSSSHSAFVA